MTQPAMARPSVALAKVPLRWRRVVAAVSVCGALSIGLPAVAFADAADPASCSAASYADLTTCFAAINAAGSGTVTLTADFIENSSTVGLSGTTWLTLDLNGHTLTLTGDSSTLAPGIGVPADTAVSVIGKGNLDVTGGRNNGTNMQGNSNGSGAGIGTAGAQGAAQTADTSGLVVLGAGVDVVADGGAIYPFMGSATGGSGAGIGSGGSAGQVVGAASGPVVVEPGAVVTANGGMINAEYIYSGSGAGMGSGGSYYRSGNYGGVQYESGMTAAGGTLTSSFNKIYATVGSAAGGGGSEVGSGGASGIYGLAFDSQGGTAVRPEESSASGVFTEPPAPTLDDYRSTGWYTSPTYQNSTTKFDFSTAVTRNQTLYASWESTDVAFTTAPTPTISGTTTVGHTLTADAGTWSPTAGLTFQWYAGGNPISGATGSTYTLAASDAGLAITVKVTGTAKGCTTTTETSDPTDDVVGAPFATVGTPSISGVPVQGGRLTADPGTWDPTGTTYTYAWFADGVPITGQTSSTLPLTADQVGAKITVQTTAHTSGYADTTSDPSTATAAVARSFTSAPVPTVAGTPHIGSTLTVTDGVWAPSGAVLTHQLYADGVKIDGETGLTLTLTKAMAGKTITEHTTATLAGYQSVEAPSVPTSAVVDVFSTVETPSIGGHAVKGSTLTVDTLAWTPAADSYTYEWYADGVPITGATDSTFTLTDDQVGKAITAKVTAHKAGYADTTSGAATKTDAVLDSFTTAPVPTVSGTAKVGSTLTATDGVWAPSDGTVTHQWYADGVLIKGATGTSLPLTSGLLGKAITVETTTTKAGYAARTTTSVATSAVGHGAWAKTHEAKMTGSSRVRGVLTAVKPGTSAVADSYRYQWYAAGKAVKGATGKRFTCSKKYGGQRISVKVTAVKAGYVNILSKTTGSHPVGTFWRTTAPQITGAVKVGDTVTAVNGASGWAPTPDAFSYQWYVGGKKIAGATKSSYRIAAKYRGERLRVRVVAKKAGYELHTVRFSAASTIQ